MLNLDCILNLFDLQEVFIDNLEEDNINVFVYISSNKDYPVCHCGCKCHIHDYRTQKIKAGKLRGKNLFFILKKRRFKCPIHKKNITEQFDFIPKRHRIHRCVFSQTIDLLRSTYSMSSIGKQLNVSVSTVLRYFDLVDYPNLDVPTKIFSIDEFKGNTGGQKYNVIITDPQNHIVLDILPNREKECLKQRFKHLNKRDTVEYFIQDMWLPYKSVCKSIFRNAKIVADKYHYARQITWGLERVRKREQKRLSKEDRLHFKRCKYLLHKKREKLKPEEEIELRYIFTHSYDIETAYHLKEYFRDFMKAKTIEKGKKELEIWIDMARDSGLKEFKDAITALTDWREEILNSKLIKETNGFTEGCNNKIKVLKRNAYGYQDFKRFRNRILHMFSEKNPILATSC